VDIFDGDQEPMVFHGKSFTSKVSLREVCEAILKYGFVASPYPIIISAEVHCSIGQQDLIAAIMMEVFGEKLIRMPMEGENEKEGSEGLLMANKIEVEELPSPEQLKGKILLKVCVKLGFFNWTCLPKSYNFSRLRIKSSSNLIRRIVKVTTRILLPLRRIPKCSTSLRPLTKVRYILLLLFNGCLIFPFFSRPTIQGTYIDVDACQNCWKNHKTSIFSISASSLTIRFFSCRFYISPHPWFTL
jgi:hypothetical protein